jgi:MarR family transcriptional regulator, organic hydroperoxide resistance regulator
MQRKMSPTPSPSDWTERRAISPGPTVESEVTWLLHRAAQRMRGATGEQADKHGIQLRDYIVLSALDITPSLTQVELGKALGLDRTTLMSQLDRLERMGFVIRRSDPRDRRARIPEITKAGNALRAKVASDCASAEAVVLTGFSHDQVQTFRRMLFEIIGDVEDRGSCL